MTVHPQERKNKLNKYILVWNIGFYERCTRYNIRWSSLSATCDRSVVFSGFLHQLNWPPQYDWNIVESSVRHHNSHPYTCTCISRKQLLLIFFYIRVHVICAGFIFCRVMRMNRFQQLFLWYVWSQNSTRSFEFF